MRTAVQQEFIDAAVALAPKVRAARDEIESEGRLPRELAEDMAKAGLFRLSLPRSMGGPECDPITSLRATEEISKADGSAGWCMAVSTASSILFGWLDAEEGRKMLGPEADLRLAGSIRPLGAAKAVEGGYMVSGRWDFASGVDHATWLDCTTYIDDENGPRLAPDGSHEWRSILVPAEEATILDTWDVVGMRGTGSKDFTVTDVFVPEARAILRSEPPKENGPLYHRRAHLSFGWAATSGNALGIARGAMDAFVELATSGSSGSTTPLWDRSIVQIAVAESEAIINSARAYLLDAIGTAWDAISDDVEDPSLEIARTRIAISHATRESVRAVDILFNAAGTNAIFLRNPFERFFRDVHVAVLHGSAITSNFESGGQALMGLHPSGRGW